MHLLSVAFTRPSRLASEPALASGPLQRLDVTATTGLSTAMVLTVALPTAGLSIWSEYWLPRIGMAALFVVPVRTAGVRWFRARLRWSGATVVDPARAFF